MSDVQYQIEALQRALDIIRAQQSRIEGYLKSEAENITRQINSVNDSIKEVNRIVKELELWKSSQQGEMRIKDRIIGALVAIIISVVVWYFTNKK